MKNVKNTNIRIKRMYEIFLSGGLKIWVSNKHCICWRSNNRTLTHWEKNDYEGNDWNWWYKHLVERQ